MNARSFAVLSATLSLVACGGGGGGSGPGGIGKPDLQQGLGDPGRVDDLPPHVSAPEITFEEVSVRTGLTGTQRQGREGICNNPFLGSGSAWGDVDLDGDVDLFATNHGGPNFLYLDQGDTNGDGLPDFVESAAALGIQQAERISHGAVFVDPDNDGDQDLFVTHLGGNTLWKSALQESGQLAFSNVTASAGLVDEGRAITAAWGDLDRDGFLDLYLAKHALCLTQVNAEPEDRLYHARGDGSFEDWSRYLCADRTGNCRALTGLGFSAAFLDSDNDGDPDLYLANDATHGGGPNRHWRNDGPDGLGGWLLPEVSAQLGDDTRVNAMGLGVGDFDNDGWLDLAFSNIEESHVLRNWGDGSYEDITATCGVLAPTSLLVGWGTAFLDADNDGWLDLFFANGLIWGSYPEPDTLLRNNHDMTFADVSRSAGVAGERQGRCVSTVDFDRDGYVDLFVGNIFEQPYFYRNTTGDHPRAPHWLVVTAEGTVSNRDGIGTRLTLTAPDGMKLTREISSGPSHGGGDERAAFFGLGSHESGTLDVRWPTGLVQHLGTVAAGQRLHLIEPR